MNVSPGPLTGVRVLDLSRLLPGAFCTHILRDLGARVTKIEPPGGDPLRRLAPLAEDGESAFHHLLGHDKRSVTLDLRVAADRARLELLLDDTDVVVDNFRAATAAKLGLSRDAVRAARPELIHCAITGYGQAGANANVAGHDLNFVAEAGLLSSEVTGRREPALPPMFIADVGGGAMSAVIGILAALVARDRTGEGAFIDISMHHASLYWLMLPAVRHLVAHVPADAPGLPTDGSHACYNVYLCADRKWIALGALEEQFWAAFCARIGKPTWVSLQYDRDAQPGMIHDLGAIIATRTRDEWVTRFADANLCLSPVRDPVEALAAARALLTESGRIRRLRAPFGHL